MICPDAPSNIPPDSPKKYSRRPPRLARVFSDLENPLYFVTFNTRNRQRILANREAHRRFCEYGETAARRGVAGVGRYVLMPDHAHLFVRMAATKRLGDWIGGLKRWISAAMAPSEEGHWQPGFFDHVVRSSESYREKWRYVAENPVRAGLVENSEEWPFAGEIVWIDRA